MAQEAQQKKLSHRERLDIIVTRLICMNATLSGLEDRLHVTPPKAIGATGLGPSGPPVDLPSVESFIESLENWSNTLLETLSRVERDV